MTPENVTAVLVSVEDEFVAFIDESFPIGEYCEATVQKFPVIIESYSELSPEGHKHAPDGRGVPPSATQLDVVPIDAGVVSFFEAISMRIRGPNSKKKSTLLNMQDSRLGPIDYFGII
jgi:hypothetical protein